MENNCYDPGDQSKELNLNRVLIHQINDLSDLESIESAENIKHDERVKKVDDSYNLFKSKNLKILCTSCKYKSCNDNNRKEDVQRALYGLSNIKSRIQKDAAVDRIFEKYKKEMCSVLKNGGFEHYLMTSDLIGWAGEDLKNVSKTLLDEVMIYTNIRRADEYPFPLELYRKMGKNTDKFRKLIHNFVGELSAATDNVYYMISKCYDLTETYNLDEKRNIEMQLKEKNSKLAGHLERFSSSKTSRRFKNVRNSLLHNIPDFEVNSFYGFSGKQTIILNRTDFNNRRQIDLFDYLFNFYDHAMYSTTNTIEYIVNP